MREGHSQLLTTAKGQIMSECTCEIGALRAQTVTSVESKIITFYPKVVAQI
jgi:hypothetical protein